MSRRTEQARAIEYGRDVVKRLSTLILELPIFDEIDKAELFTAREIIKYVLTDWQTEHNKAYNPANLDLELPIENDDYDDPDWSRFALAAFERFEKSLELHRNQKKKNESNI